MKIAPTLIQVARKAGVDLPKNIDLSDGSRPELMAFRKDVVTTARAILDDMDGADGKELRDLERAHAEAMQAFDIAEAELTLRDAEANDNEARAAMRPIPGAAESHAVDGRFIVPEEDSFALRSDMRMTDYARRNGAKDPDLAELSTGGLLRAMVLGPKNDAEKRALSEGTDSAGGYTVPEIVSANIIDRLRAASTVFRAGAMTVPLESDTNHIAKVATDPTPGWRSENASIDESDPTFARVTFTPRSLAVIVRVSRELLEDSLNMNTALPDIITKAMAEELDRVALLGSGSAPEPEGVVNFSGLTSNTYSGGSLASYSPLITARTALRTANSDVTAYIMHPRDEGTLADLTATDGQPLQLPPAIANIPMLATSKMPTDGGSGSDESQIIAGDWSRLMVGIRNQIRIEILRERYSDNHQYGFVAHMRADVAAEHEAAFTVLDAITIGT